MLKLGHLNIDDDAEGLGDDDAQGLGRRASGRTRRIRSCTPNTLNLAVFEALHEFYSCSAGWVGLRLAV